MYFANTMRTPNIREMQCNLYKFMQSFIKLKFLFAIKHYPIILRINIINTIFQ